MRHGRTRLVAAALGVALGPLLLSTAATAADRQPPPGGTLDIIDIGPAMRAGRYRLAPAAAPAAATARASADDGPSGEVRTWLGLDETDGVLYPKAYERRAVGEHIEVWVATDLRFPEGDCRNDGVRHEVTDAQVAYLVEQFDTHILPISSRAFSVAPERDGTAALFPSLAAEVFPELELADDEYVGEGDDTVVLIDNVRDDNYYDEDNAGNLSYVAGFFSPSFNELFDRNVMTIDAWDWAHRTGAAPPHEPSSDLCRTAPARPFLYEGVFAHEYQHLLEYYASPGETDWLNEGLADWAQTITGYVDLTTPVTAIGHDSHVQCFMGHLDEETDANPNPRPGGPENSLTVWGDQGDAEILCDYGAAATFMQLLHTRYGDGFMRALHNDDELGLASLDDLLRGFRTGTTAAEEVHDWAVAIALDHPLERSRRLANGRASRYSIPTLSTPLDWDGPDAAGDPGAPPNGSDYVRFRDADGRALLPSQVHRLTFEGSAAFPTDPVAWVVDPDGHGPGNPALHSGAGHLLDRAIVVPVDVPAAPADATVRFATRFDIEPGWDFAFVQVSTDGGETYTSLPATGTTDQAEAAAIATVHANLPGFTGISEWTTSTADLSAYAGRQVLLAFRYVTDEAVAEPGFWVDDVMVGDTLISDGSTLTPFASPTQARPEPVDGWRLTLVAHSTSDPELPVVIVDLPLADGRTLDWSAGADGRVFARLAGPATASYDMLGLVVTHEDPDEDAPAAAAYELRVNGVLQAGGGSPA